MRAVIQRVTEARVQVDGEVTGEIGAGLVVLLGISRNDTERDANYLLDRILGLRIFADENGKMNRNIQESRGALLLISQFTLYADCTRGRRPGFEMAAAREPAAALYQHFLEMARRGPVPIAAGVFQAHMTLHLVNDGPVTIILDSPPK